MRLSRRSFLQLSSAAACAAPWMRLLPPNTDPSTADLCRKLASDPLRPQYHLMPAHNWMNDPNGPIFYRGRYHMFHQYNPHAAVWGNMNWAHATSEDMIHWKHEGIALSPTPGGPDRDGVFSGSAVLDEGKPTVIYTAVAPPGTPDEATLRDGVHIWRETQCLAVAQDDNLRNWRKLPEPVIATPPAGLTVTGFRDPCLWREGKLWMLILGSGVAHKGGTILLYSSPNLRNWTYLHPLVEGATTDIKSVNPVDSGEMWECPDFFPLGNKHVLLISTMGKVRWKVGTYANQRFTPEREGVVDWGSYYAAKTMLDSKGNRILWGWIPETRPDAELIAAGWAGVMSLPRVLSLSPENDLQMEIAPAAQRLRGTHVSFTAETTPAARRKILDSFKIQKLAAELIVEVRPRSGSSIQLQSDGGTAFATIAYTEKPGAREMLVNNVMAPLSEGNGSRLRLHLLLDGSVMEVFIDKATSLTARIYQTPSGPLRIKMMGDVELVSFDAWQMLPISNDRLTSSMCS
jgi:beta-fructofuranosidase